MTDKTGRPRRDRPRPSSIGSAGRRPIWPSRSRRGGSSTPGRGSGCSRRPGVPRDVFEKVEDAATVARYTGIAKTVALHIPWDTSTTIGALAVFASERGIRIGGINSNTFQDEDYKLGSLCHPGRRRAAQGDRRDRHLLRHRPADRLRHREGLAVGRHQLPGPGRLPGAPPAADRRPARRSTRHSRTTPGWCSSTSSTSRPSTTPMSRTGAQSLSVCQHLGERAQVCVDTGHHAMGVNIEQIVAILLQEGRLGAFDLNDKKYGDDDLMVGSIDPYQLFRIFHELVGAMRDEDDDGRADHREPRRLHARPVPQHRAEDPGDDPLGHDAPGDVRPGAARRHGRAARRPGRAATCSRRTGCCRTPSRSTSARCSRELRRERGLPADPYRAYLDSGEVEAPGGRPGRRRRGELVMAA